MKHIYANLKRFDIPAESGGVNRFVDIKEWGEYIVTTVLPGLKVYGVDDAEFVFFLPEAHLLSAKAALKGDSTIKIGCQSVYREDTNLSGNIGAFTSNRTANAMVGMGVSHTIIGHCEERTDKRGILSEAGIKDESVIDRILNKQIQKAATAGIHILYCVGEDTSERANWKNIITRQLEVGLNEVDVSNVTIAYEPVWAIGPNKEPPGKEYIQKVAQHIKTTTGRLPVVYGGGLKKENAAMLSTISQLDGGLVALTRFSGDIGFYPSEYLEIIQQYLGGKHEVSI